MVARGVVKFFKPEKGWGAISCDELPDGQDVWVHFSTIEAPGYRALRAGDVVDFDYEAARQDSFNFRATRARRLESGPAPVLRRAGARVVIAAIDTPDTPLTPKRHGRAE
jgi:cold shock protein